MLRYLINCLYPKVEIYTDNGNNIINYVNQNQSFIHKTFLFLLTNYRKKATLHITRTSTPLSH